MKRAALFRLVKVGSIVLVGTAAVWLGAKAVAGAAEASASFMPHGYCYMWDPWVLWLHVISDGLITLSYYCIPPALIYFVLRRRDLPITWPFWMFGLFILGCGTTHLMEIWTVWHASYVLSGIVKAVTAAASVATAMMLVPLLPKALALPSSAQLHALNHELVLQAAEREKVEQQLRETLAQRERALKEIADQKFALNHHAIVATTDVEGTITYANDKFCAISQYSREELIGQNHRMLKSGEHSPEFFRQMYHTIASGQVWRRDVCNRAKDGSCYWLDTSIIPFLDANGNVRQYMAIRTDVTQNKRREEARERMAAAVVDSSDDAIMSKDLEGMITAWNAGAEKVFGYTAAEAVGKAMLMLMPQDRTDEESDMLARIRRGERIDHFETVRQRKDGKRIHVSVTISPIKDASGAIVGASKIARDITGRKQAEEVRELLAAIVESSNDAVVSTTLEGNIVAWNRGAEKIFGYTAAEVVGKPMLLLFPPDRVHEESDILARIRNGESVGHFETVRIRKDGKGIDVSPTVSPIKDSSGTIVGTSRIIHDISERKQSEERLAGQSEELSQQANELLRSRDALEDQAMTLQSVLGSMGEGLVAVDREGEFLLWNAAAERMLGAGPPKLRTNEWPERFGLYLPDRVTPFPIEELPVIRALNGTVSASEMFVRNSALPEGAWIEVSGGPRKDSCGRICGGVVAFRNITERKRADDALAEQAEELSRQGEELTRSRDALEDQTLMLQSVLDSMGEGLIAADEQGKFLLWNPAARTILGRGVADVPPLELTKHYGLCVDDKGTPYPIEQDPLFCAIQGTARAAQMFLRNPELGTDVWIEASGAPLKDKDGTLRGGVVAFRDITQNRALERERQRVQEDLAQKMDELARSNAQLEQFAYVASHDLQEPLRMVANYTQLLAERYGGKLDEQAEKYIHYAVDGAMRMQAMIQDLLAFSRSGRRENDLRSAASDVLVEQALKNLGAAVKESGAVIEFDGMPKVMVNASQITQLFQNLIGNAIKFRGVARPEVRISAEKKGGEWVFAVADNGIGIAPEHAEVIFAIFQRLHTRAEYSGNGIGLAICKKIVERHGGRIWVESAEGRGSTFKFSLPDGTEAEAKAAAGTG